MEPRCRNQKAERAIGRGAGALAIMVPAMLAALGPIAVALPAVTADDLRSIEDNSSVKFTTLGRRSGEPRTVTIWFVHDGGRVYVQAGKDGKTQWYRNLRKRPEVTLAFGRLALRGSARPIEDPGEAQRVHELFRRKYWLARLGGWFGAGFGRGKVVLVESLERSAGP